jgi:hypothetical protein
VHFCGGVNVCHEINLPVFGKRLTEFQFPGVPGCLCQGN